MKPVHRRVAIPRAARNLLHNRQHCHSGRSEESGFPVGQRKTIFLPLLWTTSLKYWLLVSATAVLAAATAHAADSATITFSLDFPNSDPAHYTITVSADGHVVYECVARISAESDDTESYKYEFDLTTSDRARIFELASQAHYFSGKVDSGNRKLAFTGSKKLTYTNGSQTSTAEYNYSTQPAVQQLTDVFQKMAATLEYGRRLVREHRFQKLALDDELKRMESQAHGSQLAEISAIQPILQAIVDDSSVINVVRARAQRLIEMGKSPAR